MVAVVAVQSERHDRIFLVGKSERFNRLDFVRVADTDAGGTFAADELLETQQIAVVFFVEMKCGRGTKNDLTLQYRRIVALQREARSDKNRQTFCAVVTTSCRNANVGAQSTELRARTQFVRRFSFLYQLAIAQLVADTIAIPRYAL